MQTENESLEIVEFLPKRHLLKESALANLVYFIYIQQKHVKVDSSIGIKKCVNSVGISLAPLW